MKNIIKTIKSLFKKNKSRCCDDYAIKLNMMFGVIFNRVRLANAYNYKYVFSIIPLDHTVIIKCQTYNNISSWMSLSLMHYWKYSKENLSDYIDKELKVLINEVDSNYNCYKASKNEKDN